MELTGVINKMKEKVDQLRREKTKMNKLTENSEKYRKNAQVIRSKNMEALVNCSTDVSKSCLLYTSHLLHQKKCC